MGQAWNSLPLTPVWVRFNGRLNGWDGVVGCRTPLLWCQQGATRGWVLLTLCRNKAYESALYIPSSWWQWDPVESWADPNPNEVVQADASLSLGGDLWVQGGAEYLLPPSATRQCKSATLNPAGSLVCTQPPGPASDTLSGITCAESYHVLSRMSRQQQKHHQ